MAELRPAMDFNSKTDAKLVHSRGSAVYTGVKDHPAFTTPPPPVDMAVLKSGLDTLSVSIVDAMDGGRKAIADREQKKKAVIKMLRRLAHYVEAQCQGDINILLASGFAVVTTGRKPSEPLSQSIRGFDPTSISGQQKMTLVSVPAAYSYELRYAPVVKPGETPAPWIVQAAAKIRVLVTGLTPGVAYQFQVRALTGDGFTDWSDSVTRIAT